MSECCKDTILFALNNLCPSRENGLIIDPISSVLLAPTASLSCKTKNYYHSIEGFNALGRAHEILQVIPLLRGEIQGSVSLQLSPCNAKLTLSLSRKCYHVFHYHAVWYQFPRLHKENRDNRDFPTAIAVQISRSHVEKFSESFYIAT